MEASVNKITEEGNSQAGSAGARVPGHESCPGDHVPLGHSIEHVMGVGGSAASAVRSDDVVSRRDSGGGADLEERPVGGGYGRVVAGATQ